MLLITAAVLVLTPSALAHGIIISPIPRGIGNATSAVCGSTLATAVRQDNTSYVEQLTGLAKKDSGFKAADCNLFLCKGLQYADNVDHVYEWEAGQVISLNISMRIPHLGTANVSIVDTKKNEVVGDFLRYWPSGYSPGRQESDIPIEQRQFNVTVPSGLETTCATAGDCVLQWWWFWNGTILETFESCVDFKIKSTLSRSARLFKA